MLQKLKNSLVQQTMKNKLILNFFPQTGFKITETFLSARNPAKENENSNNINEVIGPVLNFLFYFILFFYDKISQVQKITKKH